MVFAFDSISINDPTGIVVTGNRGLVLGSRGDLVFKDATLDIAGGAGSASSAGAGGPGAEGAARAAATDSDPPGDTAGNGGAPGANDGRGRGAGGGVPLAGGTVTFGASAAVNAYGGYVNFPGNERRGRGGRVAVYSGIYTTG
jgi:hypothetical protein